MKTSYIRITLFVSLLNFCVFGPVSAQQTVEIAAEKDNTIYEEDGALSNGSGSYLFAGKTGTTGNESARRALVAFDVAANIPEGAVVESAELKMFLSKTAGGEHDVAIHKLEGSWGEAGSDAAAQEGKGASASSGDATWTHRFYDSDTWNASGGDYAAEASASITLDVTGACSWGSNSSMVADVQDWLDEPETNFGWILVGDESTGSTARRFNSRENGDEASRPVLAVTYSLATTGIGPEQVGQELLTEVVNFPNPFAEQTAISYRLAEDEVVTLKLCNILGQELKTVVNEFQLAGNHTVPLSLPEPHVSSNRSGLFYAVLTAGAERKVLRLVVTR